MADKKYKYDVAISFLSRDEDIAIDLHERLSKNFDVFVYAKKQKEIAGTDGTESFRKAFRTDSRMVVVLFRDGWGETPWTGIEQEAITDRFLKEGRNWLLFIMVDGKSTPPPWLPETRIRFNLGDYGIEQAVGVIKSRLQELGSQIQKDTAIKKAKRVERELAFRAEKQRLFSSKEGVDAATREFNVIRQEISKIVEEINNSTEGIEIKYGSKDYETAIARGKMGVHIRWYFRASNDLSRARLTIREFNGRIILPDDADRYFPRTPPEEISSHVFEPDITSDMKWCWRSKSKREDLFTSHDIANFCVKALLSLINRIDKGEITSTLYSD